MKFKIKNKLFVDPWLDSYKEVIDDISIDRILDKQHNDVFATIAKWTYFRID